MILCETDEALHHKPDAFDLQELSAHHYLIHTDVNMGQ